MDVNCDRNDECQEGLAGWQVASRGIELALNNRIEDGIKLLKNETSCLHRQAGYCYITFIVSFWMENILIKHCYSINGMIPHKLNC